MEKIITLFNVLHAPWHVLSFAINLAKESGGNITGVFLSPSSKHKTYPFPNDMNLTEETLSEQMISKENEELLNDDIKLFNDECAYSGISADVKSNVSIDQFIDDCKPEHLIIADTRAEFINTLLPKISCPVLLTGEKAAPNKSVLMLDERESSRHAIKKFAEVLPKFTELPATIVSVNLNDEQNSANAAFVKSLHGTFKDLEVKKLNGNIERELLNFLQNGNDDSIVVMGAFGRSGVSRFFQDSLANVVLDETRLSLFIVHL